MTRPLTNAGATGISQDNPTDFFRRIEQPVALSRKPD